jgi:hypothetical protein
MGNIGDDFSKRIVAPLLLGFTSEMTYHVRDGRYFAS